MGESRVKLAYNALPSAALPAEYTTYSAKVFERYSGSLAQIGITKQSLREFLQLRNFKFLPVGGHFRINYRPGYPQLRMANKATVTETKKDDGTVTKTTSWAREGSINFNLTIEVVTAEGNTLEESIYGNEPLAIRFPANGNFATEAQLNDAFKKNGEQYTEQRLRDHLFGNLRNFSTYFTKKYDIWEDFDVLFLEYPKGKDIEGGDSWEIHAKECAAVLNSIPADGALNLVQIEADLAPHRSFWTDQLKNFNPSDKKQQRYYHCAAFNLAVCALAQEQTVEASALANELAASVKWNADRAKSIARAAELVAKQLPSYPMQSRHFALRELNNAKGPVGALYGEDPDLASLVVYDTFPAYIVGLADNRRVAGKVVMREGEELDLRNPNFRFLTEVDEDRILIKADLVQEFGYGGYIYHTIMYKDRGRMESSRPNFFRTLEDGPKLKLLRFYPSYGDSEALQEEFIAQGTELSSLSPTNSQWINWKTAFGKFFEDCPAVKVDAEAGIYRRKIEDIATAIRQYNSGNCEISVGED
ncbi:MAG: hypothetical protein HC825_06605 [Oscillatoriales cyanobacterium RM1_1_9]|nr:hypothetical protein [Oscillatoriales cyanobacterium RM1_1_9]